MSVNTDKAFDAVEIRDTSGHTSVEINNGEFIVKTLIIENSLNQLVSFQCQGSAEESFDNPFNIGGAFEVAANTNSFQTCDSYIPFWRVIATCPVSPTTGALTLFVMGADK